MGEPAIGFGITKQRGANAVQVGHDVRERLGEIEKQLPEGLFLAVNFDTTVFVEEAIHEILFTLVLAALLTSLVCWLFLGSWSTTLNVLLAIPTSLLGTFIVMYFFGFTLNTYTLLGLSLAVGIVVDDAIMVLENIYRHREQGEGKVTAASRRRARDHLRRRRRDRRDHRDLPAGRLHEGHHRQVLLPVRRDDLGRGAALAARGAHARADAPVAHARGGRAREPARARGETGLRPALAPATSGCWCRRCAHRKLVLAGAAASVRRLARASSGCCARSSCPRQDMSRFGMRFQTPVGSSIETTERVLDQIEAFLRARPEVDDVRRLRRRLRRRRGQQRLRVRDDEGAGRAPERPEDWPRAVAAWS